MNQSGLLTCTAYAFPPNSLHYCGPEKQLDLIGYQQEQIVDRGLTEIIEDFQTLYPYLTLIAHENNIADPFDPRVVEAYWIGNTLLKNVSMNHFYLHLAETLGIKKRIKPKDFEWLTGKIPQGALPHHTFHVLNIFLRMGNVNVEHTIETMDACRIGWGRIKYQRSNIKDQNDKPNTKNNLLYVETQPLVLENGKLALGKPIVKTIQITPSRILNTQYPILNTWVSFHWNTLCDIITAEQARRLGHYTNLAINLANQTI